MTKSSEAILSVRLSTKVYRFLLFAYPSPYRQEYGPHMAQVFRDLCLRTYSDTGLIGMLRLWGHTLMDFFSSVIEEHLQRGTFMSRQKFVRLSGFALVLAGLHKIFAYLPDLSFRHASQVSIDLLFPSLWQYTAPAYFLLAIGLLGVWVRYARQTNLFGKSVLVFAIVAAVTLTAIYGASFMKFLPVSGNLYTRLFPLWPIGVDVLYLSIAAFGLSLSLGRVLPFWKTLPFFASLPYLTHLINFFAGLPYDIHLYLPFARLVQFFSSETNILIGTIVSQVIPGLGWLALGLMLISLPSSSRAILSHNSLTAATR